MMMLGNAIIAIALSGSLVTASFIFCIATLVEFLVLLIVIPRMGTIYDKCRDGDNLVFRCFDCRASFELPAESYEKRPVKDAEGKDTSISSYYSDCPRCGRSVMW
jgi:hypothetical protein